MTFNLPLAFQNIFIHSSLPSSLNKFKIHFVMNAPGMSTVSEVLTAIHCGLEVLAISLITNVCQDTNDSDDRDDDLVREVFEQVDKKKVCFLELVTGMIARISALSSEKER